MMHTMVVTCDYPYPVEREATYQEHFQRFPYPLSDFQKYSVQAIVDGHHTLVSAATGNGKTVSADFAIQHFVQQGKKVIYTCPIKSLSNQKFYDFSQKYPDIRFGIFTGDVKFNPTADVIFATAEILMNYLFSLRSDDASSDRPPKQLQFQMDIQTELACVVMDECHFILDEDRGHVWENTILMLPPHVQMVLLSATLDQPEKFAQFCERGGEPYKEVVWSSTMKRIVPLTHYGFMTTIESLFKKVRDKDTQAMIRSNTNSLIPLKTERGDFQEAGYHRIRQVQTLLENNQVYLKRSHVLNTLGRFLVEKEMLPALVFTFSRKNVELFAREMTTNLLEFDSKVPYTIQREAEQLLRRKLPNYQEYMQLPEYVQLIQLLEKGIGIHHSGMIPILREIVEFMISQRHIKMLFATDSFSIGLNCEIKTVVFTAVQKFDGKLEHYLAPHAYTQMAGRAGRRNIDTVGHVVHCNNLFSLPSMTEYKSILCGKPQPMESKFHITYATVLNLIKNGDRRLSDFRAFVDKSLFKRDLLQGEEALHRMLEGLKAELQRKEASVSHLRTPSDVLIQYLEVKQLLPSLINKRRKEAERQLQTWKDMYPSCEADAKAYQGVQNQRTEIARLQDQLRNLEENVTVQFRGILDILVAQGFLTCQFCDVPEHEYEEPIFNFTERGHFASQMAEIHPLVFTHMVFDHGFFETFTPVQLVAYLSCFTDVRVPADLVKHVPTTEDPLLQRCYQDLQRYLRFYDDEESQRGLNTGIDYQHTVVCDLLDEMVAWTQCTEESACKQFIQEVILQEKQLSLGDFIKAMLKISAIAKEWMSVCEFEGKIGLAHKLQQVDELILKHVCTTQSLYV